MSGANGSWADPVAVDFDAALKNSIHHVHTADAVAINGDAATLPGEQHCVLAEPISSDHHAVVRWAVQVEDVLHAELDAFMLATDAIVSISSVLTWERDFDVVAVCHLDVFSLEQIVKFLPTDVVVADLNAHSVLNDFHVLLTDETVISTEAATMIERLVEITWAHQVTMGVMVAVLGNMLLRLEVLNDDRLTGAHMERVSLDTLAKED